MPDNFAKILPSRYIIAVGAIRGHAQKLKKFHQQIAHFITPQDTIIYGGDIFNGLHSQETIHELLQFRCWFLAHSPWVNTGRFITLNGLSEEIFTKLFSLHLADNPDEICEFAMQYGLNHAFQDFGCSLSLLQKNIRANGEPNRAMIAAWTRSLRHAVRDSHGLLAYLENCKFMAYSSNKQYLFINSGLNPDEPLMTQGDNFWLSGKNFHAQARNYSNFKTIVRACNHWRMHDPIQEKPIFTPELITLDAADDSLNAVIFRADGNINGEKPQILTL